MNPSALSSQLVLGLHDFLRVSFSSSTPGMQGVIGRIIDEPGAILKGPYVSVKLPFEQGTPGEFFPEVPLGFPAHKHQEAGFARLSATPKQNTLVATGTGSGKTETFLWPILHACLQDASTPGIKAILIYPMNALATDQAERIAKAIHNNPNLAGTVRAGLYIGESKEDARSSHKSMGPDHLITDRKTLQVSPPDILLTNYKMLDYLLIRPGDQELWKHNKGKPLQFLVVDELHTFDGAQGTDLACLIRRLKDRLGVAPGELCCVGTSATLGGGDAKPTLRRYASDIFGESFPDGSVVGEQRISAEALAAGTLIRFDEHGVPGGQDLLDPSRFDSPQAFIEAQVGLWFDEAFAEEPWSDAWRVELGDKLLAHGVLRNLLTALAGKPAPLPKLVETLQRASRQLRQDSDLARRALVSFIALISEARAWLPESDTAREQRLADGRPQRTRPFLEVRLQLWQRELNRMVASVNDTPTLRFSQDLSHEQAQQHLPMIHCRDCSAMGWATLQVRDKPDLYRTSLDRFYRAFFSDDPMVRFLWPAAAAPKTASWSAALRMHLNTETLVREREPATCNEPTIALAVSHNTVTEKGTLKLSRHCPFCSARGSLTLIGFRAATLTSVYIDQLFASRFNDDKKLLTFSDSVQDAAHRAGFFGARTWRFNLRVALQRVLSTNEGISLQALASAFAQYWTTTGSMSKAAFVCTFLPPNMDWMHEYEQLQETGELPVGGRLLERVTRRIAYEVFAEFGMQARIGRSFPRTGNATVYIDSDRLNAATDALLPVLQNDVGGLRALKRPALHRFLLGALHHLREQGGIYHNELPEDFVNTSGRDTYAFNRGDRSHLPSYGRKSRMPALITDDPRSPRFDTVMGGAGGNWYARWADHFAGSVATLAGASDDVWSLVLPVLVEHSLLRHTESKQGQVWGLQPPSLRVTTHTVRLQCTTCGHWQAVAAQEQQDWQTMPCLTARCVGEYETVTPQEDYFRALYRRGEVARVFAAEHTGLLTRTVREDTEQAFKADASSRQPWSPNLLSCTPTLEMGIDIGALSSAVLCSVPPAQANYLQRIGRAGRRDGNSFLLTIALGRAHDQYFFSKPEEMITGAVTPPGIFLNASAVLERQLAAFCLDRWIATGVPNDAVPRQLIRVFDHLGDETQERFPHNWLGFVTQGEEALLADFLGLFGDSIGAEARAHLRAFLLGDKGDQGSLHWEILEAFNRELAQRQSLADQAKKAKAEYEREKATLAKSKDHDERVAERRREFIALERLVKAIDKAQVLQFLTDRGLLPNYAFPESPIRLKSVIWRKKATSSKNDKSQYETKTFEYARPAMAAISELAPNNTFFAGARNVTIEQIDVGTSTIETWRFCDKCAHSTCVDGNDPYKNCPNCGSPTWGEDTQKGSMLRLEQVFAKTSDRRSRIRDDADQRQPRFYNRRMLMSFHKKDSAGAFHTNDDKVPFGFEYLKHAQFQEVNFGEASDDGSNVVICGREEIREGFVICKECGMVQPRKPKSDTAKIPDPKHTLWCSAAKQGSVPEAYQTAVYLYRQFNSEAIRLLLPLSDIGSEQRLNSFLAGFQLGLRDKYGGRVDHLHTLLYFEPEEDGFLRRQYLVLYDTVPGGTGYLKDFTQPAREPGARHPLFDILQRAVNRMSTCACVSDPEKDGCYRCVYAYRNSREMEQTSRTVANEMFGSILALGDQLSPVDSLSNVSISGLMDSVLEARFIEALRRHKGFGEAVVLYKDVIRNKPGFRVIVAGQSWSVEQQRELGDADGIRPSVSIDFVLHPDNPKAGRKPIAVFLDGFQYHRDRVSHDMLQRMTLLTSGYDVWTFTWHDIDEAFRQTGEPTVNLLGEDPSTLSQTVKSLCGKASAEQLALPLLDLFVHDLGASDSLPAQQTAATALFSQLSPTTTALALEQWHDDVRERAPAAVYQWLSSVDSDDFLIHRPPSPGTGFGLWVAISKSALSSGIDPNGFRGVVWLDDRISRHHDKTFVADWRSFLRVFQLLRSLPNLWFLTQHEQDEGAYASLSAARTPPDLNAQAHSAWDSLDVYPEFQSILRAAESAGAPLPSVGVDLPSARGEGFTTDLLAELLWDDARVAVVEQFDGSEREVAAGWTVFALSDLADDATPLLTALSLTGRSQ